MMKFFYSSVLFVGFGVGVYLQAIDKPELFLDEVVSTKSSFDVQLNNVDLGVDDLSSLTVYERCADSVNDAALDFSDVSLPILFRGDLSPANAAYTISRSGVYQLTSAKTASGVPNISITANNVTLDLGGNTLIGGTNGIEVIGNNITVKNGTISGMTQNGVLIQGSSCRVENCDVVSSTTGITLQNTSQCVIEKCRVRTMTHIGISLQSTWTSSVRGCEISDIHGGGSVYGLLAQNGGNNTFEQCAVRDVQTNSSLGSDKVVGSACINETASTILATTIQAIESLTTVSAYGVWIDGGNNAGLNGNSIAQVTTGNAVGIGVFVNQVNSYVANNVCYDCDSSFTGVSTDCIDSQANARGVDNIDTNLITPDQVEVARDLLSSIESKVDVINNNSLSIQTIVDNRFACSYTPITAATIIATPGAYCLANTISNGDLSVTATGVTLYLNGRTIYNGTLSISGDRVHAYDGLIRGKTAGSGVVVTGNKCTLNDLRVANCLTGFELNGADQNSLENCQALNCTREGYLLTNATYNTLSSCQATSIVGTGTVAGIKTSGGIGNEIVDCTVNRINSTETGDAYGIWGVTESRSQIHDNQVNDVSAAAGVAKGLVLDEDTWLRSGVSFEWTFSTIETINVRNVDWLSIRPGLSYVAIAEDQVPNRIRIFRFNEPDELNLCYELSLSGGMFVARWLRVNNISYLAVGGFNGVAGTDFKIYIFDEVSETLLPLPNAIYTYDTSAGLFPITAAWLRLEDDRTFLAIGGSTSAEGNVRILSFDGNYLSLVTKANTAAGQVRGIDWVTSGSRYFLAVSTQLPTPALTVYEFDPTNNSLTSRATYNSASGDALAVRWLSYKGDLFLGLTLTNGEDFRVLKYTPATNTLTYLKGVTLASGYSESCDWMVTGTSLYAVFSAVYSSPELNVYSFDQAANTLTPFYQSSFSGAFSGMGLRCFTGLQGRALIAVGFDNTSAGQYRELMVVGFDLIGSTTSIVQNNTVSNISGTGIAVNGLSNPVLRNKVYNATTPYEPWKPFQLDPSNNNGIAYS